MWLRNLKMFEWLDCRVQEEEQKEIWLERNAQKCTASFRDPFKDLGLYPKSNEGRAIEWALISKVTGKICVLEELFWQYEG